MHGWAPRHRLSFLITARLLAHCQTLLDGQWGPKPASSAAVARAPRPHILYTYDPCLPSPEGYYSHRPTKLRRPVYCAGAQPVQAHSLGKLTGYVAPSKPGGGSPHRWQQQGHSICPHMHGLQLGVSGRD